MRVIPTQPPMIDWLYPYSDLYAGTLIQRFKRFFVDVALDSGQVVTAHCANTGPMTGVSTPGSAVYLSHSDNPKRKLQYTLELIQVNDNGPTWVGVNTGLPNRVMQKALQDRCIPELEPYQLIKAEVPYGRDGKSRIDFLLSGDRGEAPTYVEVKNTTWVRGPLALFPDTVTTRGQKHLQELMALRPAIRSVMVYFINRGDCLQFAPGDGADPLYGQLLRQAVAEGVEVLPCRFDVSPEGVRYLGLAELKL